MEDITKNNSSVVKPLSNEETSRWKKCAKLDVYELIRVGPQGYVLPSYWMEHADDIRNMQVHSTDIWVVTFPRSGTTWTQELVWLINNELNFDEAKYVPLSKRYGHIESSVTFNPVAEVLLKDCKDDKTKDALEEMMTLTHKVLAKTPSPRFIKSHLPLSLQPNKTLDTCKVVYVARDPRDVAVSFYYFLKGTQIVDCEFKDFFDLFVNDISLRTPFFAHVKEAWMQRHHPNMLFLFYEELSRDLKNTAKRVADFFGKTYTEEQFNQLCEHLTFKNFQSNRSVSSIQFAEDAGVTPGQEFSKIFVRKGKVGGWRDYFDVEMTARAQAWMQHNLQDTDLRFPLQEF